MNDSTARATYTHAEVHGAHRPRQETAEEQRTGHRHAPATGLVHGDAHGRLTRADTAPQAGTSQQPALVIHRTRLGDDLRGLARAKADIARTAGKTSGAAATLKAGGRFFTAISTRRTGLAPELSHALHRVPPRARSPYHGSCAEIGCLDQALRAGQNPRGGDLRVVEISGVREHHGRQMVPCSTCEHVLRQFGVEWR